MFEAGDGKVTNSSDLQADVVVVVIDNTDPSHKGEIKGRAKVVTDRNKHSFYKYVTADGCSLNLYPFAPIDATPLRVMTATGACALYLDKVTDLAAATFRSDTEDNNPWA